MVLGLVSMDFLLGACWAGHWRGRSYRRKCFKALLLPPEDAMETGSEF